MRPPVVALAALIAAVALPAVLYAGEARSAAPATRPAPARPGTTDDRARPDPATSEQAAVAALAHQQLFPAYPQAQLALARRLEAGGRIRPALEAAEAARSAADRQLELHKSLSETLTPFEQARGERAAAREAGLVRDEAAFLIASLATRLGDRDLAVARYTDVVLSQPDAPLGAQALAGLKALGFLAAPRPASPAPAGQDSSPAPRQPAGSQGPRRP